MRMLGIMAKYCIKVVMSNHFYLFNGQIRRQVQGRATGNTLTMELSRLFGTWWDERFLSSLKKLKISIMMYERYVDDTDTTMKAIDPGVE